MFGGEQVSLKEYAGCETEEQNDVYYITGESIDMVPLRHSWINCVRRVMRYCTWWTP